MPEIAKPWEKTSARQIDAPTAQGVELSTSRGVAPFMHGLKPEPRAVLPGYDSNVLTLLLVVFLFMSVNFRSFGTFVKTYTPYLFKERRRESFYDAETISETRVLISLLLIATVSEGILIFSLMNHYGSVPPGHVFQTIMTATAGAIAYYLLQLIAYSYVGFVFADPDRTRQWIKGFHASQAMLGVALAIPALVVLFNPGAATILFSIGATIYLAARITFICKGFRLFYDNFGSLIYFILYLCTLEFIPLLLAAKSILV